MCPRNVCTIEKIMRSHNANVQNLNLTALKTSYLTVTYMFANSWSLHWLGGLTAAELCNISDQKCRYYVSTQCSDKYMPYGKMFPTKLVDPHEKLCTIFGIIIFKKMLYTFVCFSRIFPKVVIHIGDIHEQMSELIVMPKESVLLRSSSTLLHAPVADTFY